MALTLSQVQSLFGIGAAATPAGSAGTAIPALRRATAEGAEARGIARAGKDPVTLTAVAQFRRALEGAETIEDALRDPRILKVLLPALGLADQAGNPGLVRKALLSDPNDDKGLAARLGATWKAASATLGAWKDGLDALRDPAMVARLSDAYLAYQYRKGLDEQQAGLSDALYFLDSASRVDDAFDILGDPVLRRVVTGALGLPREIAVQSVEAQGRAVRARLDIAQLQDPKAVRKLAERYLIAAANEASASEAAAPADPLGRILTLSLRA